ncbi:MAG: bifunctional methylenetetrahydrofolate dehydrogenase/methenyltetrahydrofolate cyclohydrolase FolD [Betaproteobacteria bacterium]|nr:bifunctional methylenetetrahydrofolate dehydrogenase/methenyltetrahydrofolate cyclohydrolase FolD [Betaproteobacteria bacterium]
MTATLIDGLAIAKSLRLQAAERAKACLAKGRTAGLAVVLIGNNPASQVYVRNKIKACAEAGITSRLIEKPESLSEVELLSIIDDLNRDPEIDGILVQMPLPKQLDAHRVIEAIAADKDVDGFHVSNAGALMTGRPLFQPCTPYGVIKMLESIDAPIWGAHAVICGASNIVGKPMAMMLLARGATVTVCNSKTQRLQEHTRRADILVSAVGRPNMISADMVKPGAIVIDVGINRLADGRLVGDVDFASVSQVASAITPVPGGVGPMTIAMLLINTIESAERRLHLCSS